MSQKSWSPALLFLSLDPSKLMAFSLRNFWWQTVRIEGMGTQFYVTREAYRWLWMNYFKYDPPQITADVEKKEEGAGGAVLSALPKGNPNVINGDWPFNFFNCLFYLFPFQMLFPFSVFSSQKLLPFPLPFASKRVLPTPTPAFFSFKLFSFPLTCLFVFHFQCMSCACSPRCREFKTAMFVSYPEDRAS